MASRTVVVLGGDQTGQELLLECLRVLAPEVTRVPTAFVHFDLSLATRRATQNAGVREAARAMAATGLGLKAATITPEGQGDVGSPNAILREAEKADLVVMGVYGRPRLQELVLGGVSHDLLSEPPCALLLSH